MKRGNKSPRRKLVAELDRIFSLYIRARDNKHYNGICPLCKTRPIEINFHVFPRKNMPTRWDERFCYGADRGCNYNEFIDRTEKNKARWRAIYIGLMGEELYAKGEELSKSIAKYSTADLEAMIAEYRGKLEDLK